MHHIWLVVAGHFICFFDGDIVVAEDELVLFTYVLHEIKKFLLVFGVNAAIIDLFQVGHLHHLDEILITV